MSRKEMKQNAKRVIKGHYWILLVVCLIAAFAGLEFENSLDFTRIYDINATEDEIEAIEHGGISTSINPGGSARTFFNVVGMALQGDETDAKKESQEITDEAEEASKDGQGSQLLGRSRGVLAGFVNSLLSGALVVSIISAANHVGISGDALIIIGVILALLLFLFIWFFIVNTYRAVSRRIFLESRTYEKVPIKRFAFFIRVKRWSKVAFTLFMTTLFYTLWCFTIVGAVIKHYSYIMVPYIIAENPDIGWRKAIKLSREMMNGHKWECFVLDLSFLPWGILGIVTFGLSNMFFLNMYEGATYAEYYVYLRKLAKNANLEFSDKLDDTYLFEKADSAKLEETYADIIALSKETHVDMKFKGFTGFLANVFGITIAPHADEEQYQQDETRRLRIANMQNVIDGKSYPARLFPLPMEERNERVENLQYLRHYSITSLIMMFFIFSFIGWVWEVSLHLIADGRFVNRGVLHGPWLPIYGSGGILILVVLNKFRSKPWLEFITTIILCGCVEYFTSYYLEMTHNGKKWWDYSGYFLNLNGRICAEGLLVFGLGGMAIVYFAAPMLDNFLRKIKYRYSIPICAALLIVFVGDEIYSSKNPNTGAGITDYTSEVPAQLEEKEPSVQEKRVQQL